MIFVALDPGLYKSSFVAIEFTIGGQETELYKTGVLLSDRSMIDRGLLDCVSILDKNTLGNAELAHALKKNGHPFDVASELVIEEIKSYGNVMGDDLLKTVQWTGRFMESTKLPCKLIPRKTVATIVCDSPRANDSAIRQACIDYIATLQRFLYPDLIDLPSKTLAVGTAKDPGPLYGIKRDEWQALGLGLARIEQARGEKYQVLKALR